VSIGAGCVIGNGVRLSNCVVMRGVIIKDHSKVRVQAPHASCSVFIVIKGKQCAMTVAIGHAGANMDNSIE